MEKTAIASVALAAALFAVSCQKENTLIENVSGPMTISAVSEGLNSPTKTELAFKYDVLWSTSDKIYVKDASGNHDTFSLTGGAGTTKGTFKQDGQVSFTGEVEAYYPATMLQGGSPLWPVSQTNDQTIPMYCKKTLSGTTDERMDFASLGSVLQIVFNTTQENVTLKSIEIKDGSKTMSGEFTVNNNGMAIITATDKAGITLDLGTGVALGKAANYFNIAVPAGDYQGLTLVFTATDGTKCTMTGGKVNIAYNTVGRLTLTGEKFKSDAPEGALPGKFSVSNDGGTTIKQVHFSRGNLYYDGSAFKFETNQYEFPSTWNASHVGHFFWSKTASVAYAASYSDESASGDDVFFTNATVDTPNADFTVNGVTGQYRTLSKDEWNYLFKSRSNASTLYKYGVTVIGKSDCVVIAPDNWDTSANPLQESYDADDWATAESAGLVCLPAAGSRFDSGVSGVGGGAYWSSALGSGGAYGVSFGSDNVTPDKIEIRNFGFSVRLITDVK